MTLVGADMPLPHRPLAFLWHYIVRRPWHFGGLLLVISGATSSAIAVQYGMKLLVDAMTGDRATADVWWPLVFFMSLIVLENIFWRLGGWQCCRTLVTTCMDIRVDLFQHLTGHPMRYFNEHFAGSLGSRIAAVGSAAESLYNTMTWRILPPLVDFAGAVVVLTLVDGRLAIALVFFVLLVASLITVLGVRGRGRHQLFAAQAARVGGELVDAVSNVWTIKAFAARARETKRLAQSIAQEANAQRSSWMYMERIRVLHDVCLVLMAGSLLGWSVWQWQQGAVTSGDVVLVSTLTFRILHGSRELALALVESSQQLGAIADTLTIINQPHALSDGVQPLQPGQGRIEFAHIGYRYPGREQVFNDFSVQIPAGQKVGIVGSSGAGKSTLISLLQRLDDVQGGHILIDGQDIRQVSQDSLRQQIAVVPQETALFNRSIRENIRYGRPDASDAEVETAARHAYCDRFIRELPEGYDTLVGERGVMLSGGQRQRLGIARAFLKNAPILILDEATSALDTHSELEIQAALNELVEGRTVLAVAHRLSTLSGFDRILVLDQGRIVEDGSPEFLRQQGGLFERLWRLQAEGFALEETQKPSPDRETR